MARLFSKHDAPLHLHAVLGFLCLLHFVYRYGRLLACGDAFGLVEEQEHDLPQLHLTSGVVLTTRHIDTGLVLLHALLHLTSFRFDLPAKRNFTKPMIWPEFRLHSAVFAVRHVACTLAHWWLPAWWTADGWNVLFVVLASECAGYVTRCYGDSTGCKRTTNAMPYPEGLPASQVTSTKAYYVAAQVGATTCAVWGTPTLAFFPLCAIELAPFMMTLVRKGKASALWYHRVYALALLLNYPTWMWVVWHTCAHGSLHRTGWLLAYIVTQHVAPYARFHMLRRYRAGVSWVFAVWVASGVRWALLTHLTHIARIAATTMTDTTLRTTACWFAIAVCGVALLRVARMARQAMGWMV